MYTVLKVCRPFEGNRKADVAPGDNEFDTPAPADSGKSRCSAAMEVEAGLHRADDRVGSDGEMREYTYCL